MLIRNATLPDGRSGIDVLVQHGRIAAVGPALPAPEGVETVDAQGLLLSPPFVDPHFHMDATLSYGLPRVNRSGTLLEGIALWGELKPLLTQEALVERALAYCDWAVAKGLLAIRSHVDVCDDRLLAVEALLHVKQRVKPYLDLQLVAFPQDGLLRSAPSAMVPRACACCANWRPNAGCRWTCIATRATTRCRVTSRRWRSTASASGCTGA
jgi:cytosine/creatinine deaminase